MRININQKELLNSLEHTLGVVDKKATLPILAHCLVEADGQGLTISATDLEISFRGTVPAVVAEPGSFTILAHNLHTLVKSLPDGELEVEGDEEKVNLVSGEAKYKFLTLPPDQFPPIPTIEPEGMVEVPAEVLKNLIDTVIFSMGDDLQYHLQGALWEKVEAGDGISLRLVTTDGHRLSIAQHPMSALESVNFGERGLLVPAKALREIKRFVKHNAVDGLVLMGTRSKVDAQGELFEQEEEKDESDPPLHLCFRAGDRELSVRLLEYKFPEYRRIIPETAVLTFSLPRQEFVPALRRVASLSTEKFRGVILTLNGESCELVYNNPEVGRGREVVKAILEQGEPRNFPFRIGFNARYLLEPMSVMKGDWVVMEVADIEHARPVKFLDSADHRPLWLVMPMEI
ncbi:MAG: DNA polymerase III subunit beta [Deltaproteobacteria bacterium]|nr:DNA polymerase III subunit beta [Deltaproteobacteria bacterium]